jgi:hypothetical protein
MGELWRDHPATPTQIAAIPRSVRVPQHRRRTSQADLLIALLRARHAEGKALELYEIRNLGIYQHTARFFELRERGFVIENQLDHAPDGTVCSRYWLRFDPDQDGAQ